MRMKPSLRALVVGVAVAGMMCVGGGAYAVTSIARSPAVIVTGPDHERLTITLAPGGSRTFALPAANDPLRIDLQRGIRRAGQRRRQSRRDELDRDPERRVPEIRIHVYRGPGHHRANVRR
jgi:hypothetical protein